MTFNVPLFQFHLFKNIEEKLKHNNCTDFIALPSVTPDKDIFVKSGMSESAAKTYIKYISSTFRVDINNHVFYMFFRSAMNKSNGSFTVPSSLEITEVVNGVCHTLIKNHYFNTGKNDYVCQNTDSFDDYNNPDDMKKDLIEISNYFTNKFSDWLEDNGIV